MTLDSLEPRAYEGSDRTLISVGRLLEVGFKVVFRFPSGAANDEEKRFSVDVKCCTSHPHCSHVGRSTCSCLHSKLRC